MNVSYHITYAAIWALSKLPLRCLYLISDALFPVIYYVVRYRRRLAERQLADSFPEKSEQERRHICKRFYHQICDYIVETVKMMSMSPEEMMRHVCIEGFGELQEETLRRKKQFMFFYLGHFGNWEWLTSYGLYSSPAFKNSLVYHPLKNKRMNSLFMQMRSKFGTAGVPMKEVLRYVLTARRTGQPEGIGFVADQSPKWEAMHHWVRFLNHDTSFFIGAEKIAKSVDAAVFYCRVTRPSRGHYHLKLEPMVWDTTELPDYEVTNRYVALLEEQIRQQPELWLWSHNRWKRTREEWERRQRKET